MDNPLLKIYTAKKPLFDTYCKQAQTTWQNPTPRNLDTLAFARTKLTKSINLGSQVMTDPMRKYAQKYDEQITDFINMCVFTPGDERNVTHMKKCQTAFLERYPEFTDLQPIYNAGCSFYDIATLVKPYAEKQGEMGVGGDYLSS